MSHTFGSTLNGIGFDELPNSPTFSGGRDGPKAQRRLMIAWSDTDSFLAAIFPAAIRTGKGWTFPVSASFPGKNWMTAQEYKVDPWDKDKTIGYDSNVVRAYDFAVVTIDYKSPEYDPNKTDPAKQGDQILADYSSAYSAEMLKLGVSGWIWETGGDIIKNEEATVAKVVVQIEHTLTWNYVPYPPFSTIGRTAGCVNSDTKLFFAPAETLLFTGAEIKRSYHSTDGDQSWKVTYKFLQRLVNDGSGTAIGWNHMWRNDKGTWDKPMVLGQLGQPSTNKYIYEAEPFGDLFYADGSQSP